MNRFMRLKSASAFVLVLLLAFVAPAVTKSAFVVNAAEAAKVISASQAISETTSFSGGLTIAEGVVLSAPEGKSLAMTVGGVEQSIKAGTYNGPVVISVTAGYKTENMGASYQLRTAAFINNGAYDAANSVSSAVLNGKVTDKEATDVKINSQGDNFNGIVVAGDSTYSISNADITLNGHGGDDFAGYGAGITTYGNADVKVENAVINTTGAIRTAIWAGGNSKLLVKNSKVIAKDGSDTNFPVSMMNEVPWILGLSGNLRATNVLGSSKAVYLNSSVQSEKWGALSTDSTRQGASLTTINTDIIISGKSGYGSYADGAVLNYYYGSRFTVPDMALIVAAGQCGATFGKSTEANVGSELYKQITSGKADTATTVKAGTFGVMWHKNQGGVVAIKENTVFDCGETVFLIKSDSKNTAFPIINVDNSTLNSKTKVILHLMECDDPGMGGGRPGSETMWAKQYVVPTDTTPVKDANDPTVVNTSTAKANFSNMKMTGDIYNSRFTGGQNLSVSLDNASITGVISSGTQKHTLAEPGEVVTKQTYYKIGHVKVTPSQAVCNGSIVALKNGSTWNVTGTSYITSLTVDATSSVVIPADMIITVNGKTTSAAELKGAAVTGNIVFTASK